MDLYPEMHFCCNSSKFWIETHISTASPPCVCVNERWIPTKKSKCTFHLFFCTVRNHRDGSTRDRFENSTAHQINISPRCNYKSSIFVYVPHFFLWRFSEEIKAVFPYSVLKVLIAYCRSDFNPPMNAQSYWRCFGGIIVSKSGTPPICTPGRYPTGIWWIFAGKS